MRDRYIKREGGLDGSGTKENTSIVVSSKGIHLVGTQTKKLTRDT